MLTREHIQEDLSRAYIQAVAARAGVNLSIDAQSHDYGVDGAFHQVSYIHGKRRSSGYNIEFQTKASTQWSVEGQFIVYDLDAATYNYLVQRALQESATPIILILFCMPNEDAAWLWLSEDELRLRRCCYWMKVNESLTTNAGSVRIRIPRHQVLDPPAITGILDRLAQEEL